MNLWECLRYYPEEPKPMIRPCECGNRQIALDATGCEMPNNGDNVNPIYAKYLYILYCSKCKNHATDPKGWVGFSTSLGEAIGFWNNNPHKEMNISDERLADLEIRMQKYMDQWPIAKEYFGELWNSNDGGANEEKEHR